MHLDVLAELETISLRTEEEAIYERCFFTGALSRISKIPRGSSCFSALLESLEFKIP